MHPTRKPIIITDYEDLNCPIKYLGMENMVCRFENFLTGVEGMATISFILVQIPFFMWQMLHRSCS